MASMVTQTPTCILEPEDGRGALYLGSLHAVANTDFLVGSNIRAVITCAATIGGFYPTWIDYVATAKSKGVEFTTLDWIDSLTYTLPINDITSSIATIHAMIQRGDSVLVHCAQGKHRSCVLVVAYLTASMRIPVSDALSIVKQKRFDSHSMPSIPRSHHIGPWSI